MNTHIYKSELFKTRISIFVVFFLFADNSRAVHTLQISFGRRRRKHHL